MYNKINITSIYLKIAIIGAGAAGIMTAATINELNPEIEVFLIERNPLIGNKVIISGGGRCNVTTGFRDIRLVLERYPRGGKFLNSAMYNFHPEKVYDWFEAHGVPLKIEEDLRVFPVSNNGKDIVGVFEKIFADTNTKVLFQHIVTDIEKTEKFTIHFKDHKDLEVDKVVITTGGQAYRHTGSKGDGYHFAESLGHTITKLAPSLNSFICSEKWITDLAGVSLKKAKLKAKKSECTGPFLFTHKGITGPAVFALSSMVAFEDYSQNNPLEIFIDLVPDNTHFDAEFRAFLEKNPKKDFDNSLAEYMPRSLAQKICKVLEIKGDKNNNEVAKKDINKTIEFIKRLPLHAVGRGAGDEFVTAGGVELKEVDSKTMESKKCPGLYFAGEVLDIDGFTGGYNLQASWATGRLAGESIAALKQN